MKTPPGNHDHDAAPPDWMRWLDGEMPAAERAAFEKQLEADPALRAEAEAAGRLSELLKTGLPAEMPVPHADFFNSQIQVRLAQMEADERRAAPAPRAASWTAWLRSPWLFGATAAAALVAVLLLPRDEPRFPAGGGTLVMSTYAPNPKVVVSTFHSDEAGATVLMLEGLEELPANRKIVGWNLQSSDASGGLAGTPLRGDSGQVEVVVMRDARNNPFLWTPRS